MKSENALQIFLLYLLGLSAAKKRFALSEETDLEATTEESIECVSSSDPEKSKKEEAHDNNGKVEYRSHPWTDKRSSYKTKLH